MSGGKRNWSTYNEGYNKHLTGPPPVIVSSHKPITEPEKEWEKVPVWKQEALDEQGRKRLHGAFRGGYSAGYFNTVGSKEGWTPTTFKSSRQNRANFEQLRPTDFMDDEDLEEAAERQGQDEEEEVDLNALGMTQDEIARRKKKQEELERSIYGGTSSSATKDDGDYEESLPRPPEIKKPKKNIGMGVGVFNDDGEDDEDIYEIKPKSGYDRVLGGEKKKKKKKKKVDTTGAPATTPADPVKVEEEADCGKVLGRHVFVSKKGPHPTDNTNRSEDIDEEMKDVKADEDEMKKDILTHDNSVAAKFGVAATVKPKNKHKTKPPPETALVKMEAEEKPEKKEPEKVPTKSVFDFIKPAARDRIAAATGKADLPPALGESGPQGYVSNVNFEEMVPRLEADIAANALKGFLPYADDLKKRERYKIFLEVKAGVRSGLPARKLGMSNEDWAKEMNEFTSAARIFKPATGQMASRFTSSSSAASQIATGDGRAREVKLQYASDLRSQNEDPALAAAKMSMYGPMTRSVTNFYPSRLLCKRFNVPPPSHSEPGTGTGEYPATSSFNERAAATAEFAASFKSNMEAVTKSGIVGFTSAKSTPTHIPGSIPSPPRQNQTDAAKHGSSTDIQGIANSRKEAPAPAPAPAAKAEDKKEKKAGNTAYKRIFGDDSDDDEED